METLELIENIRAGREVRKAQEQLYDRVRASLLARIESRLTGRVRARLDSEDVLHEAFLRAIRALDLFDASSEKAFFAWVFTIAKNLIIDQAKRRSVAAIPFAAGKEEKGPRASQIRDLKRRPESLIMREEILEDLLRRLKPRESEVIRLHRIQGLSFAEIAEKWGKTSSAVQRFFSRAWKRLGEVSEARPK